MRVTAVSTLCLFRTTPLSAVSASLFKYRTCLTLPLLSTVYATLGLISIVNVPAAAWLRTALVRTPVQNTSARQAARSTNLTHPGFRFAFASASASAISSSLIFPIE